MKLFWLKYYSSFFLTIVLIVSCNELEDKIDKTNFDKEKIVSIDKSNNEINLQYKSDTPAVTHTALIKTSMGNLKVELFGKDAPKTVENFVKLSKSGYYNGVLFHRVAKNFLIQTGDGNTKFKSKKNEWGLGGKSIFGKEFNDEINPKSPSYNLGYRKGILAMANRGPNTNTSQFFICLEEAISLEPRWTIFGRVVEGMDVVEKISKVDITAGTIDPDDGLPVKPIKILSITIKAVK